MADPTKDKLQEQLEQARKELADEQATNKRLNADLEAAQKGFHDEQDAHAATKAELETRTQGTVLTTQDAAPVGPKLVTVVDDKSGLKHELPQQVLDALGKKGGKRLSEKVEKPAEL